MSETCRTKADNLLEHQYRDFFAMHVLILHDVVRQLSTPLEVRTLRCSRPLRSLAPGHLTRLGAPSTRYHPCRGEPRTGHPLVCSWYQHAQLGVFRHGRWGAA